MDHTIEEGGERFLLYNTLNADGYNVCITKMRPKLSLTKKPQ